MPYLVLKMHGFISISNISMPTETYLNFVRSIVMNVPDLTNEGPSHL